MVYEQCPLKPSEYRQEYTVTEGFVSVIEVEYLNFIILCIYFIIVFTVFIFGVCLSLDRTV